MSKKEKQKGSILKVLNEDATNKLVEAKYVKSYSKLIRYLSQTL